MNYPTDQYGYSITAPTSKTIEIKLQEPIYARTCAICGRGIPAPDISPQITICQDCKDAIAWVKRMMEAARWD